MNEKRCDETSDLINLFVAILAISLAGCAGPKVLPIAYPLEARQPLAVAADSRIAVVLDAVVVRDAPGSWSKEAHWDEYRLRARSLSGEQLSVVRITVYDALGHAVDSTAGRGALIDATRAVEKRYEESGKEFVEPIPGGGWQLAGGVVAGSAAGGLIGLASVSSTGFLAGAAVAGAAFTAGSGVLIGAGVAKIVNNVQVSAQLERRQSGLPAAITAVDSPIVAFFPIVPLPRAVELTYRDGADERRVRLDTQGALVQAHAPRFLELMRRPLPTYPREAIRRFIRDGRVTATLLVDAHGDVEEVGIIDASAKEFVEEARQTFLAYKYNAGAAGRRSQEVMQFKRH